MVRCTWSRPCTQADTSQSFLHKFTPGGGWVFASLRSPFQNHFSSRLLMGGVTSGHPNIWERNGTEVIIVPVKNRGLHNRRGSREQAISLEVYEITGGSDVSTEFVFGCLALGVWNFGAGCLILGMITGKFGFDSPDALPPLAGVGFPLAGVAILPDPQGGAPRIFMTDRKHQKSVFAFSPQAGFTELVRIRDGRRSFATPRSCSRTG